MQKSRPSNPSSTAKPRDQYTMMTSCKQQQPLPPSQQQAKDTDRIDASQKFYIFWRLQHTASTTTVLGHQGQGRDNHEARFHCAPNPRQDQTAITVVMNGSRTAGKPITTTAATFTEQVQHCTGLLSLILSVIQFSRHRTRERQTMLIPPMPPLWIMCLCPRVIQLIQRMVK